MGHLTKMQLPSIERSPNLRPSGVDMASSGASRVIPVAPVNPASSASVVNQIDPVSQASAAKAAEAIHVSVSDPARPGSEAATSPKDWTIRRPEPEKVEEPPKEPISKMLIELVQSMWRSSRLAVEVLQVQNPNQNPDIIQGRLVQEELTYSPSKIKKSQNL